MGGTDPRPASAGDPFAGEGEIRALARGMDWSRTPLGPVESWSETLRTTVRNCLASPFPINLWCGPELVLIYNDAYSAVLGTKHPRALGQRGAEVWAEIWGEIEPMFERIRSGGEPVYADDAAFHVRRADGDPYDEQAPNAWFTFSLSGVSAPDGTIVAFLNIVSESTGRVLAERALQAALARAERAEQRLLGMFEQAPAFIALLRGTDHVFEYVNNAYYDLVGKRDLLNRPVLEAMPELSGQGFDQLLDSVLSTGEAFVGREVPAQIARGEEGQAEQRYVDLVYYPITEADGSRSGVVAHGSDVTDHVRARQEAQRARSEAEEANRAKSQFLANMSHEIRTPINAIIGYTDLLELGVAGPLNEDQRSHLERVRTSSRHLLALVDDILDLAKVEAGRMEVTSERLRAADTIGATIALIGPQAVRQKIQVHAPGPDDVTEYVGDSDRTRQILANLLSNAVKFTPAGGEIRISCGVVEQPDPAVEANAQPPLAFIRVADTGIGIDDAQLEQIFRPFTQVERGHTRTRGGTGLGLTISRHLARLMGGDLTVDSQPGAGSTFTLWLPTSDVADVATGEPVVAATRVRDPHQLAAVSAALQRSIPAIIERFSQRLRSDPRVGGAAELTEVDLVDHTWTFLASVAQATRTLASPVSVAEHVMEDGGEIQRVLADLHGRQRSRLGWTSNALAAEWQVLVEEVEGAVRASIRDDRESEEAIRLLRSFLARAERVSRRALRMAVGPVGDR